MFNYSKWLLCLLTLLSANILANNDLPNYATLLTSKGEITLQLHPKEAPDTVKNFVRYVKEGHYDNTIFHRVIPGFVVQAGGFTSDFVQKPTHAPVVNEASNGLLNNEYTVAMARTADPHSATSQFYINLAQNDFLNYSPGQAGYAVFAKVVSGHEVIEHIASTPTQIHRGMADVPKETITIIKAHIKGN